MPASTNVLTFVRINFSAVLNINVIKMVGVLNDKIICKVYQIILMSHWKVIFVNSYHKSRNCQRA